MSCLPGLDFLAPSTPNLPIWPEDERVTTQGSSSMSSATSVVSNTGKSSELIISVRRSLPNC